MNQIIPPELLVKAGFGETTATPSKFDRKEFYPSNLAPDESQEFRLLGCFGTGHAAALWRYPTEVMRNGELGFGGFVYKSAYPGKQPEGIARKVNWASPGREKIDNEFVSPKQALVWLAWSYSRERVELLIIEQKGLKETLTEVLQEAEDYTFDEETGVANFLLKVSRKGTGLETSYSVLPKPKKVEAVVKNAFAEIVDTAQVVSLLDGGHPLLEAAASFSSKDDSDSEF